MKTLTIILTIVALIVAYYLYKLVSTATSAASAVASAASAALKEQYIAPSGGYIPVPEPYANQVIEGDGSPFLEGVMQTVGIGNNRDFNAPSSSLLEAQQAAKIGLGTNGLIGWMDVTQHNLAGVKGMNL
jgi:hypothetical protein